MALAMSKKMAPHLSLNFLTAELALWLEKFEIQRVVHHHLRGSWNKEADWLSRIGERTDQTKPVREVPLKRTAVESHTLLDLPAMTRREMTASPRSTASSSTLLCAEERGTATGDPWR